MRSTIRTCCLVFLILLAGIVAAAGAEDWTQWRGADRLGVWHDEGILERFPEGGLEVVWRSPIGPGYAGPAVAAGRVFVLDWEKTAGTRTMEGTERVVALDEATGKLLWEQSWPVGYGRLMTSYAIGPRATPTVDGDRLYVVGAVGDLLALDSKSGEVLWQHDFVEEYDALIPTWGVTSAPLVDGDLVISVAGAEPNGKFIAYDKVTGEELWRIDLGARTMGAPMTYLHEGRQFLVVATGGTDRGAEFVALSLPEDL